MYMRWHTKPIMQLVAMFAVMVAIVGVQQTAASFLSSGRASTSTASLTAKEGGLVDVQAGLPNPTCPNTDPIQYAFTENNLAIAPPRRMRYVDAPWEYNSLNETYFTRTQDFDQAGYGTKAQNIAFMADDPNDDKTGGTQGTGVTNMMSSMFRYKPTGFKNAYILKYTPEVVRDDPSPYKGDSPAIEVPSKAGWPVCMPTTGYDIGGGYEAMVVSVDSNRITLHIGIHEYMDGRNTALGGCPPGQQCRGGYWLYVSGINVDSDIVAAYNLKKDIQQSEGLSSNITDRIQLPIVKPGRRLGTSQGDGVTVLLRDSGPIIYANKNFMWGGGFPEYDPGGTPLPTATITPPPDVATTTPIPPTGTPAPGSIPVTFRLMNQGAGSVNLNCTLNGYIALQSVSNQTFSSKLTGDHVQRMFVGEYTDVFALIPPGTYTYNALFEHISNVVGHSKPNNVLITILNEANHTYNIPVVTGHSSNSYYQQCIGNSSSPTPTTPPPVTPANIPPCVYADSDVCYNQCMNGKRCTTNCAPNLRRTHFCEPPLPTIVPSGSHVSIIYASCDNFTCQRLMDMKGSGYQGNYGLIYWESSTGNSQGMFPLGSGIVFNETNGRTIFKLNLTNPLPNPLPSRAYLLLPFSVHSPRYYIIGGP